MAKRPYRLHFVCNGNVFRSRIAEGYMRSFNLPNLEISSSGLSYDATYGNTHYTLSPYALDIAKKYGFQQYLSPHPTQTTQKLIDSADLVVYLYPGVLKSAKEIFHVDERKSLVWNVPDFPDFPNWPKVGPRKRLAGIALRRIIFGGARHLKAALTHGNWVDAYDKDDQPTGLCLPVSIANQKGLYHRGSHVVLITKDGKILVQKRSKSQRFAPGLLDITLGGICDAGEDAKSTAVRETREECGLDIAGLHLIPAGTYTSYTRHSVRSVRNYHHSYIFIVHLPQENPEITLQRSEVSNIYFLSPAQLKKLIRRHSLRGYGKLNYSYSLYEKLLPQIIKHLPPTPPK